MPSAVRTPPCTHSGLGSFPFARRYLGNRFFFLFLRVLRCFSSPSSLIQAMYSLACDWSMSSRVSPFRYLRFIGYLLLPEAFRSLSRLSSAPSAKASTLRSLRLTIPLSLVATVLDCSVNQGSTVLCFCYILRMFLEKPLSVFLLGCLVIVLTSFISQCVVFKVQTEKYFVFFYPRNSFMNFSAKFHYETL